MQQSEPGRIAQQEAPKHAARKAYVYSNINGKGICFSRPRLEHQLAVWLESAAKGAIRNSKRAE
jgi:hypothetical protein